jgi:hypothetical protein
MKRNMILASILVGLLAAGCGKHNDDQAAGVVATSQAAGLDTPPVIASATSEAARAEGVEQGGSQAKASADSLPPDVSASAPDSLILPGTAVEIIARGTPDVVAITVWDGIGQKQPMSFDSELRVWRAFYRVPLRTSQPSVGLSVTARNAAGKWRRVWTTLRIHSETPEHQPEPAPGS